MKKLAQHQDDRLLDYIDGTLTVAEREQLEQDLRSIPALRQRLDELETVCRSLKVVSVEEPSKNFTQQVMDRLDQYPVGVGLSTRNGLILLAGVMAAIVVGSFLLAGGAFDKPGMIDLNTIVPQNNYLQQRLPTLNFNGRMIMKVIILLNIGFAFMVLDRTILKPWFDQRRKLHLL
ncbi:MAG: anti-sigma factor family protein [Cyclobacteriaceae bacterium]